MEIDIQPFQPTKPEKYRKRFHRFLPQAGDLVQNSGLSLHKVAKQTKVPKATLYRYIKMVEKGQGTLFTNKIFFSRVVQNFVI